MSDKPVKLKKGSYNEITLVDKVCSDAQRRSYHKKERFASGKHHSMFLDTLARYCDYEYDIAEKKYIVTEVYEYPKTLYESKIHKGIYQYLAPLMLYQVLFGENRKAVVTSMDLAKYAGIVNDNYENVRYNQDAMQTDLGFSSAVLAEYFNKADSRIDDYIRQCIKYLSGMNCVIYNETHMIGLLPKTADIENGHVIIRPPEVRRATDDEMKLYSKLVEKASRRAKITSNSEKWYGKKAARYNTELTRLLKENGIQFVCRAFELWKVDEKRCKDIMRGFADKTISQRTQEIGTVLKVIMDSNAEARLNKNPSLGSDYLEQFKRLSDITLLYGADDIMKLLPSAQGKDIQADMRERYGYEIEYATSGGYENETESSTTGGR